MTANEWSNISYDIILEINSLQIVYKDLFNESIRKFSRKQSNKHEKQDK